MLQRYADWSPTGFDARGLGLPDRADWLVAPVILTRDSGPMEQSNFEAMGAMLAEAGPEDSDWEVHSFGHWACGWLEIYLVRPGTAAARAAVEAAESLADYPLLDDERHSELELEAACEAWALLDMRERMVILARHGLSVFAARRDEIPRGLPHWEDFYCPA